MGITSRDPDPGWQSSASKWDYLKVGNGTRHNAFLAGHPFGVMCHHDNGSKPCVTDVTKGELPCKWCGSGHKAEWRGFTPLYTEHYLWVFVVITKDYLEAVREITPKSHVRVARGNRKFDPVVIKADPWRTLPLPPNRDRDAPIDLLPSLLRCWKNPDLTAWHLERPNPVASVTPVSLPVDVPAPIAERMRGEAPKTPEEIDAKLDDVIANLRHKGKSLKRGAPSTNGTHPPADQ